MSRFEDYAERYKFVRFKRRDGVLELAIHKDGGPAMWGAYRGALHEELGDAFYQIARDPDVRILILTGTGDVFLTLMDFSVQEPDMGTPAFWDRIYKEGKDLLTNLLDIDVPVIGAVNGPAHIHAELLTLSDIVIASERASFADKVHCLGGTVAGDGVHTWWPMLLGPNRGRHFLLTGAEITAREGLAMGFVAEVVDHSAVNARVWEIALELATRPSMSLRYTRIASIQHIKKRMLDELGYRLMLEGMGLMDTVHRYKGGR